MNDRRHRFFLSLTLIIPIVIGITFNISKAAEPNERIEVGAYNQYNKASLARERISEKSRALDEIPMTPPGPYTMAAIKSKMTYVADQLVVKQNNGGWAKDLVTGGDVLPNLSGVTGLGLLMAYEMTARMSTDSQNKGYIIHDANSQKYLDAAMVTGEKLVAQSSTDPEILLSTDIIFLYGLSKLTKKAAYNDAGYNGIVAFTSNVNFDTADETYNFYDNPDGNGEDDPIRQIKHWNLASWVEAAKLYSKTNAALGTWADNLMARICQDRDALGGFIYNPEKVGIDGIGFVRTASQAKMVEILRRFYKDTYGDALSKGLTFLKGLQSDDVDGASVSGAFRWGGQSGNNELTPWASITLQDQCYGIQAMSYNFQTTWTNYSLHKGPYWGAGYMLQFMMNSNLFADDYGDAITIRADRNSEAIQALYYSCKEGDVDKSGKVIAYDALQALKAAVGKVTLDGPEVVAARLGTKSVDLNTRISAQNALYILKFSVGKTCNVYSFLDILDY